MSIKFSFAKNVLPSLPVRLAGIGAWWDWNKAHPDFGCVKSHDLIAAEVREFILAVPEPELWADYCAYDHVALCQLYGRMIDLCPTASPTSPMSCGMR